MRKHEVLQDLPAIHARPWPQAPCCWLQEAKKDHEKVQENLHTHLP